MSDPGGVSKITRWLQKAYEQLGFKPTEAISSVQLVLLGGALISIAHIGFATHYPNELGLILDPTFFSFTAGSLTLWLLLTSATFRLISSVVDFFASWARRSRHLRSMAKFPATLAISIASTAFLSFNHILSFNWSDSLYYTTLLAAAASAIWSVLRNPKEETTDGQGYTKEMLLKVYTLLVVCSFGIGTTLAQARSASPPQNTVLDGKRYSLVAIGPTSMGQLYFSPTEDLYLTWRGGSTLRTIGTTSSQENNPKSD